MKKLLAFFLSLAIICCFSLSASTAATHAVRRTGQGGVYTYDPATGKETYEPFVSSTGSSEAASEGFSPAYNPDQ